LCGIVAAKELQEELQEACAELSSTEAQLRTLQEQLADAQVLSEAAAFT